MPLPGRRSTLSNYNMVLDSSRLGIDGCARAIAALLE